MRFYDIIDDKKKGKALSKAQIDYFIRGVTDGTIPDYQIAALLMAICLKGMDRRESFDLTAAMTLSGAVIDKGNISGITVDKHSTGGVSDSTTLVLMPALAAAGLKVAKLSGRGLGHTGGTLDKLESFNGFNVNLSNREFIENVNSIGGAIAGQTESTVPADKKLYALRDVTATVDSLPLIASSIMSKKLATFSDVLLLDVKYGSGGFMKTESAAAELAKLMVYIGKKYGRIVGAFITSMNQPLGSGIGSCLEVIDAIEVLKGKKNQLYELSRALSSKILSLGLEIDEEAACKKVDDLIYSGSALEKFKQIVKAQGGSLELFDLDEPKDVNSKLLSVKNSGYISEIDTQKLGEAVINLGGGRLRVSDTIDHSVGLKTFVRLGDRVLKNQPIVKMFYRELDKDIEKTVLSCFKISEEKPSVPALISGYIE